MECGGRAQRRRRFASSVRARSYTPNGSSNPNRSTVLPLLGKRAGVRGTARPTASLRLSSGDHAEARTVHREGGRELANQLPIDLQRGGRFAGQGYRFGLKKFMVGRGQHASEKQLRTATNEREPIHSGQDA